MPRTHRRRIIGDLKEFILLILYKEGPQSLAELEEKTALQRIRLSSQSERRRQSSQLQDAASVCQEMLNKNWVTLGADAKYQLTEEGKAQAIEVA